MFEMDHPSIHISGFTIQRKLNIKRRDQTKISRDGACVVRIGFVQQSSVFGIIKL